MLLGRETELARLRALLHDAREGKSFALVVHGDAGIGKTALLLQLAEEAARDGFRLLPVRTYEGAGEIPWAGLHALAMPFLHLFDQLPAVQARTLRSALSLEPSVAQDRFTVPVALLGLLSVAAEQQPLLVIADDVQWLDEATRGALLFAARRLGAEGVGLLLAARDGEGWEATESRLPTLHLDGLTVSDARAL
ncbi:MAG TPA: ATP-binding protein, partial [Solirubrobacteraceae bacterium]|nr:ATP-binding protein [Solirubrobacteraceae bacterium]